MASREITDWFWAHLVRQDLGYASDVTFRNPADTPRYGSWHESPLGYSVCLFSDYPVGDENQWMYEKLLALHSDSGAQASIPLLYSRISAFVKRRPESYWFLSHRLDNDVLMCGPAQLFDHSIRHYFQEFRDCPTVQTSARELSLLGADKDWLISYEWDGEVFAIFFHAQRELIESVLGLRVPWPPVLDRDPRMMPEVMNACRYGGNLDELAELDHRYHLHEHEWRQVQSWLLSGVTSAAENQQARLIIADIEERLAESASRSS